MRQSIAAPSLERQHPRIPKHLQLLPQLLSDVLIVREQVTHLVFQSINLPQLKPARTEPVQPRQQRRHPSARLQRLRRKPFHLLKLLARNLPPHWYVSLNQRNPPFRRNLVQQDIAPNPSSAPCRRRKRLPLLNHLRKNQRPVHRQEIHRLPKLRVPHQQKTRRRVLPQSRHHRSISPIDNPAPKRLCRSLQLIRMRTHGTLKIPRGRIRRRRPQLLRVTSQTIPMLLNPPLRFNPRLLRSTHFNPFLARPGGR